MPLSTQQDAAIFDAQSAQLFLHKDVSRGRPTRSGEPSGRDLAARLSAGRPRRRDEGTHPAGGGRRRLARVAAIAAEVAAASAARSARAAAQLFQAKRVGAFSRPIGPVVIALSADFALHSVS